ncbi:MAG: GMC family oxidoreductase, partial [bacterium]
MKPPIDTMRRYTGAVDVCIIGAGAGGATLAKALAEGGCSVVVLEAGPWLDTVEDFINDELAMLGLVDWDDLRISAGNNPLALGRPNTGRGIGGSTIHFTAMKLRLHPEDFQLGTREGIGVDWPFDYDELAPYYQAAEDFVGTSGPAHMPWPGNPPGYHMGELTTTAADDRIAAGFAALGMRWSGTPHAILTGPKAGRSPCMYYGFCVNGCKSDAKGSALVTWVPAAVHAGAEFRPDSFVTRIHLDAQGLAQSVSYLAEGVEQRQEARVVIVCGYAIETPRLLLNSACLAFPDGLANRSGQMGRNLMVHPAAVAFGRFADPLDNYVGPPVGIMSQDPYGTRAERGYPRGFMLNRYALFPIEFATAITAGHPEIRGERLFEIMDAYSHWTLLTSQNEQLPRATNTVTLATEIDQHGLPVARVTMSYDTVDQAMLADAGNVAEQVLRAGGAEEVLLRHSAYHVLGTCRMGTDPQSSVVDADCRSHDIPNLYVCDGSVFPTA